MKGAGMKRLEPAKEQSGCMLIEYSCGHFLSCLRFSLGFEVHAHFSSK